MDIFIKRELKSWFDHQQPPAKGKARLLLVAAVDCGPIDGQHHSFDTNERSSLLASDLRSEQPYERINQAWLWVMHLGLHPIRHVA